MYTISTDHLTLEVLLGQDEDQVTACNVDAWVTLPDGTKWSATFLTHAEVGRIMDRHRESGESCGGRYFRGSPDIVILRDAGVRAMLDVAEELVATGEYRKVLHQVGEGRVAE